MRTPASKSSNRAKGSRVKDAVVVPADNSGSNTEWVTITETDTNDGADKSPAVSSLSNDEPVSDDMSDEASSLSTHSKSKDEEDAEAGDDNDGEANDISNPEYIVPSEKQLYNDPKKGNAPSQSLRQRQTPFPRIISINGDKYSSLTYLRKKTDDEEEPRKIIISKSAIAEQERLKDSDDFSYRDPLFEGECVPMQKWQETSFPNCNQFHEFDYYGKSKTGEFEYWTNGGYNHIFYADEEDKPQDPALIFKVLKWGTYYTDRNFDRVRRDGLILERLTSSPHVLDTYGFCGFGVLTPYADGGDFSSEMSAWRRGKIKLSPKTRLKYAYEVSAGLAAVHDIDGEGMSSVAHGDLKGGQYLFLNGEIKLGDFNRGRFLRRNSTAPDTACTYTIGKNDAAFRSPEEYEYLPQTSAIDVYALGSLIYYILTGHEAWHDTDTRKAQKYIRKGELPEIQEEILKSKDPVDLALRGAIDMCYVFDPKKRAKAGAVASFLQKRLSELQ